MVNVLLGSRYKIWLVVGSDASWPSGRGFDFHRLPVLLLRILLGGRKKALLEVPVAPTGL